MRRRMPWWVGVLVVYAGLCGVWLSGYAWWAWLILFAFSGALEAGWRYRTKESKP